MSCFEGNCFSYNERTATEVVDEMGGGRIKKWLETGAKLVMPQEWLQFDCCRG